MPEWIWHWSGYVVALVAFVGVVWALCWDRSRGRKRCRRCWYDMAGAPTDEQDLPANCPECGKVHAKPKHLTRTRRRWVSAGALMLVMVVGGYGLWVVPRVQERGWVGAVPTMVLVIFAPLIELGERADEGSNRPEMLQLRVYGSDLRSRCYSMPKPVGWAVFHWFGVWSNEQLGHHHERGLLQWCREELVIQSNLPEELLRRIVHSAVDQRLTDVLLLGRMDTRGERIWVQHPQQHYRLNRAIVIPRGWELDWRMLRDDGVSPRYTRIDERGGWQIGGDPVSENPIADFDPVWRERVGVRYRIQLRQPDSSVSREWVVQYRPGVRRLDAALYVQGWLAEPISIEVIDR